MKVFNFRSLFCLVLVFSFFASSDIMAQGMDKNKKGATAVSNAKQSEYTKYTTNDDAVEMEIATGCVGYIVCEVDRNGKEKELTKLSQVCLDGKSRSKIVSLCYPATNKLLVKYKKVDPKATVSFRPSKMVCK
ncbi:MAG: hypothetical protein JNK41_12465 [Saprospiraceae bacterium]|jgi:hypothetical protein|nr:hypothetical protein [Saprospiraceae bacterium]